MTAALLVVALMVLGLVLLAVEVLVLPGFGLIGVLGFLLCGGAVWLAHAQIGTGWSAIAVAGGVLAAGGIFLVLPRTRLGKSMVLETGIDAKVVDGLEVLLGREGQALTPLRPSGSVEIDQRPVDVVTDGQYVEPGSRVRVVRVEGARVVVEPLS